MSFSIKSGPSGARVFGMKSEILLTFPIIADVYNSHGYPTVLTSGTDGKHKRASEHYQGFAADFRTIQTLGLTYEISESIAQDIKSVLGSDYVVIPEHNHIHIHFEQQEPLNYRWASS